LTITAKSAPAPPAPAVAERPAVASPAEPSHLELTGAEGPVPLGYASDGERLYLIARERSARWAVNALRDGTVRLRLDPGERVGAVRLVTDPNEKQAILRRFREKYGDRQFQRWYDRPARVLEVDLRPGRLAEGSGGPRYYDWLAAEFDNVAADYDHHITGNRINLLLRNRSLAELRRSFADAHVLLEIGCGSGMETLPLLEDGHELVCVDISERMLDTVRAKARAAGVAERLRTRKVRAGELAALRRELGDACVDGAYSTYGALNCEEDLSLVPPELHRLVRHDGRFVTAVYNRWCLFELVGYALAGQPRRAFGRTRQPVPVGSSRFCVDVFAYSVPDFRAQFAPWFGVERLTAVPIVLPPSDLVGYAEKFTRRFERLAAWDRSLGRQWPLKYLGDHFLMTFVRRGPNLPASAGS
jgi:SAM-dependent methyltransferase